MTWQQLIAEAWSQVDSLTDAELVARVDAAASEAPDDAIALFERASARDATGDEAGAEPFYRAALAAGLDDDHRGQCIIQLASTVRNLGRPQESVDLLRDEFVEHPEHPLADAAAAFIALAFVDLGRERDAVAGLIMTLTPHLPRYRASLDAYAEDLLTPES